MDNNEEMEDIVEQFELNQEANEGLQAIDAMENRALHGCFVTPIFESTIKDEYKGVLEGVRRTILEMKKKKEGAFEFGNFVTVDNLQDDPRFDKLKQIILTEADTAMSQLSWKRDAIYVNGMWANATNTTHRHMVHTHPNSMMSGIIHIQSPDGAGPTTFADPRPGARVMELNVDEYSELNGGVMMLAPKEGRMLLWPSWLPHGVEVPREAHTKDRIVVAFNIMCIASVNTKTASVRYN